MNAISFGFAVQNLAVRVHRKKKKKKRLSIAVTAHSNLCVLSENYISFELLYYYPILLHPLQLLLFHAWLLAAMWITNMTRMELEWSHPLSHFQPLSFFLFNYYFPSHFPFVGLLLIVSLLPQLAHLEPSQPNSAESNP